MIYDAAARLLAPAAVFPSALRDGLKPRLFGNIAVRNDLTGFLRAVNSFLTRRALESLLTETIVFAPKRSRGEALFNTRRMDDE